MEESRDPAFGEIIESEKIISDKKIKIVIQKLKVISQNLSLSSDDTIAKMQKHKEALIGGKSDKGYLNDDTWIGMGWVYAIQSYIDYVDYYLLMSGRENQLYKEIIAELLKIIVENEKNGR